MRQLILPSSYEGEGDLTLSGKESRYLVRVLRLGEGDRVAGRTASGQSQNFIITKVTKEGCTLTPTDEAVSDSREALPAFQGPFPNLVLLQCLLKGRKEDEVVRQAAEIGVATIALVESQHCVATAKERANQRLERLNTKVREALQQSGSPVPTNIEPKILPLADLPSWWNHRGPLLFFHQAERGQMRNLQEVLAHHRPEGPVGLLIGPEGGFSDTEYEHLIAAGCIPVLLKTNILRSETAALYTLSAIQVLLNERL